jgi:hypothetical protein
MLATDMSILRKIVKNYRARCTSARSPIRTLARIFTTHTYLYHIRNNSVILVGKLTPVQIKVG